MEQFGFQDELGHLIHKVCMVKKTNLDLTKGCHKLGLEWGGIALLNLSRLMTKPTKWLCAQQILRSAWAFAKSDQSSLCAQWVAKDLSFLHADREDSDQTGQMPGLICLRWVHLPFCWFCHEAAQMILLKKTSITFLSALQASEDVNLGPQLLFDNLYCLDVTCCLAPKKFRFS